MLNGQVNFHLNLEQTIISKLRLKLSRIPPANNLVMAYILNSEGCCGFTHKAKWCSSAGLRFPNCPFQFQFGIAPVIEEYNTLQVG
jgi:hypothetical protein